MGNFIMINAVCAAMFVITIRILNIRGEGKLKMDVKKILNEINDNTEHSYSAAYLVEDDTNK